MGFVTIAEVGKLSQRNVLKHTLSEQEFSYNMLNAKVVGCGCESGDTFFGKQNPRARPYRLSGESGTFVGVHTTTTLCLELCWSLLHDEKVIPLWQLLLDPQNVARGGREGGRQVLLYSSERCILDSI